MQKVMKVVIFIIFTSLMLLSLTTFSSLYLMAFNKKFDKMPPTTPLNVTVDGTTEETITMSWDSSTEEMGGSGLNKYIIYLVNKTAFSGPEPIGFAIEGDFAKTRHTIKNLASNKQYYFQISSMDNAGNESEKSELIKTQTDKYDDISPPSKPGIVSFLDSEEISVTATTVSLKWIPGVDEESGIKRYEIHETSTSFGEPLATTEGDETYITVKGLTPGHNYTLYIFSVNKAGLYSNDSSASPPFTTKDS